MNMHSSMSPALYLVETAPVMSERRVSLIGGLMVAISLIFLVLFIAAIPEIV